MVRFRPAGQYVGKVKPFRPVIQFDEGPTVVGLEDGPQIGSGHQDFRMKVFVKVQDFVMEKLSSAPFQDLRQPFGVDEVLIDRMTQVIQVKAPE